MSFGDAVTLSGDLVTLQPLQSADHDGLVQAASDGDLCTLWYTTVPAPAGMRAHIDAQLAQHRAGTLVPFTTRRADGQIIGMTSFLHLDEPNRRLEVGATWNALSAQRSGTNAESKLLLLTHAFEVWDCIAVEFRTHWMNHQSRQAIARLGAKQDGVLRSHQLYPDGSLRDTVVFSIIASEWPAVANELRRRLAVHAGS